MSACTPKLDQRSDLQEATRIRGDTCDPSPSAWRNKAREGFKLLVKHDGTTEVNRSLDKVSIHIHGTHKITLPGERMLFSFPFLTLQSGRV